MSENTQEQNVDAYKPKKFYLEAIPKDIYDIMIDEQADLKKECRCQKNLEQTIYSLIRKGAKKNDNKKNQ